MKITFNFLKKSEFSEYAQKLFDILYTNMSVIVPTGDSYENDFNMWCSSFGKSFINREQRKIIIIKADEQIVGFFGFNIVGDIFKMEEIQISPDYQSRYGIFRSLYRFTLDNLPDNLKYVEAYADIRNTKSAAVLKTLGLEITTTENGKFHCFKGKMKSLLEWLNEE